jgi:hypothetical protein|tara:strand:+ start:511 stop:723 length:213 start_codon:yes stop_codon:yes gene_type:complete
MSKIIIKNTSSFTDVNALEVVAMHIKEGRISDDKKAYCYLSIYALGPQKVGISAKKNKVSDTFTLFDYNN